MTETRSDTVEPPGAAARRRDIDALCAALTQPDTPEEMRRFLADLMTPGELAAISERFRIAALLDEGEASYREISAMTGASTTTVTRVARFLAQEPHQGYRLVLDRLKGPR